MPFFSARSQPRKVERAIPGTSDGLAQASLRIACSSLAAGVVGTVNGGGVGAQLDQAVETVGMSLALTASQEVASGVMGAGCAASVAGRALGALATSDGSCSERLASAGQAAGEAAATQAAGHVLAQAGVPLCPTGLINEEGRKGIEFAGGSMMSVGERDRFGSGQLADGTEVCRSSHEEGVQFRVGRGLMEVICRDSQMCVIQYLHLTSLT